MIRRSIFDVRVNSFFVFGIRLCVAVFFYTLSSLSFSAETPKIFIPAGDSVQPLSVQMEYLKDTDGRLPVQMDYLEDTDGTYTIDQVASGQAGTFQPLIKKNYRFTYKKRALWIRFTADLSHYNDLYWFLMQNYEHVAVLTVYYPDGGSGFHATEFIEAVAPGQRLFNIHNYLFKIPTPKNNPATYYVRYVPDRHNLVIDLSWLSTKGVIEYLSNTHIELGLFFGSLLALWLYNLVLFLFLHNRTYLYYLYYLGAFILTFFYMTGLAPLVVTLNRWHEDFFSACAYAAVHGMVLFARHFLDLKKSIRWLDACLIFFQWSLFVGALLCFVLPYGMALPGLHYFVLLLVPFLVMAGAIRCYQGYQPAYLYSAGWVIFSTGIAVQSLKFIGILPVNLITNYAIPVASVWEAIVFSLALATRLKLLEKEDLAKSKLLILQMEKTVEMEKIAAQQKTLFIAAVNHELRTPLQSLTGSIEVLSVMAKSSPMEKTVEKIRRASEQIVAQMRDIGEYSRLEAGVLSVRKTNFLFDYLLNVVTEDFAKMAEDKGVRLVLKNIDGKIKIAGDFDRIRQILNNLVSNAIKFTEKGTVTIEGKVESIEAGDSSNSALLSVCIEDTGIGISKEDLPKIFDTFAQLESKNKTLGTGLGLAIVKRILEMLNATISVESQIGTGSKFTVCIPVQKKAE